MLDELLVSLPGFFFSFQYLKMLATTSRRMLRAVRDRRQWQGKRISLNTEEFEDPSTMRWMMEAYMAARVVTVNSCVSQQCYVGVECQANFRRPCSSNSLPTHGRI